ncbi:hypothetical protein [Streptosporangium fragile]
MASEQSSQSHLPPAWPEAAEPTPSWANDPLGTGPRLPRPQEEPQGGSWQTSPGGNGWAQAMGPQNDAWQNASAPQGDTQGHTSPGGNGWAQAMGPQNDAWQNASAPQGDTQGHTSPGNNGWPQPTPAQNDWQNTSGPRNDVWQNASAPQGDARGQEDGGSWGAAGRSSVRPDDGAWPSAASADGGTWPPTPPGDAVWPPAPPTGNDVWASATPSDGGAQGAGSAGTQDRVFSLPSWANASIDDPAAPGRVPLDGGMPPGDGHGGGVSGDGSGNGFGNGPGNGIGTGHGSGNGGPANETMRISYGVPDNPAMWAMAAAQAAPAASPQDAPVQHGGTGSQPTQAHPGRPMHPDQPAYPGQPMHAQAHPGQPMQAHPGQPMQPGHHLSRDPSDPNKPFVTAGQISGPKTPPPDRQQELWDTVFGEDYQAMEDEDEAQGRPVWIFALAGSVVIALVGATIWAFLAGPLASADEDVVADPKPSATAKKTTKPAAVGRLPRFTGKASPVAGTLVDQPAGITLAKLGAPWRQDQRPTVSTTYGFTTRQYLLAGTDSTGKNQFAQIMSGPLSPRLKSKYTSPTNLAPVINAVASTGRKRFFPEGNTARKTAQQTLSVNGKPGQLAAYEITSGDIKTTMVVAAVSTGADVPAIVYMSVPDTKKELLPDVNTVFKSIKLQGQ